MKIQLIIGKIVNLAANPFDGTDDFNSATFSAALAAARRGIHAFEEANLFERDASVEDAALSITWWWWNHHAPKPTRKQAAEIRRLGRKALKQAGEGPRMITPPASRCSSSAPNASGPSTGRRRIGSRATTPTS